MITSVSATHLAHLWRDVGTRPHLAGGHAASSRVAAHVASAHLGIHSRVPIASHATLCHYHNSF